MNEYPAWTHNGKKELHLESHNVVVRRLCITANLLGDVFVGFLVHRLLTVTITGATGCRPGCGSYRPSTYLL